jgi:hypothetical protein
MQAIATAGPDRVYESGADLEKLTLIRIFEELRGFGWDGGYDAVRRLCPWLTPRTGVIVKCRVCAADLCAGGGLPVRLSRNVVLFDGTAVMVTVSLRLRRGRSCSSAYRRGT